jgi:hypothetical protein
MNPTNVHRPRGNWKALSATLGVGVFVTMGALTLAHPSVEVGTSSDSWKADTTITLPSAAPTVETSPCDLKRDWPRGWAKSPHARVCS